MARKISIVIRYAILFGILFSIATVYYTKVILLDYDVITNVDGPNLED